MIRQFSENQFYILNCSFPFKRYHQIYTKRIEHIPNFSRFQMSNPVYRLRCCIQSVTRFPYLHFSVSRNFIDSGNTIRNLYIRMCLWCYLLRFPEQDSHHHDIFTISNYLTGHLFSYCMPFLFFLLNNTLQVLLFCLFIFLKNSGLFIF